MGQNRFAHDYGHVHLRQRHVASVGVHIVDHRLRTCLPDSPQNGMQIVHQHLPPEIAVLRLWERGNARYSFYIGHNQKSHTFPPSKKERYGCIVYRSVLFVQRMSEKDNRIVQNR